MKQDTVNVGWPVMKGSIKIDRHTRKLFLQALDGLIGCNYEPAALRENKLQLEPIIVDGVD